MKKEEARTQFSRLIACDEADLELDRATLLIAAEEYPHLEIDIYLRKLDVFAEAARAKDDFYAAPRSRILRLSHLFFDELGFQGNFKDYQDARNSFLNDVIDRRTGIPITLSVLYLEVARRIGLKLFGVGMPGHFIIKYSDDEQEIFIDPFHGGQILTEEQCREMIAAMYANEMEFRPAFLKTTPKKQILARMLQNLKSIYARTISHHQTLGVIERLLLIHPEAGTEIRDRGLIYAALRQYAQARADLEEYLRRLPAAEDKNEIEQQLLQLRQRQAQFN